MDYTEVNPDEFAALDGVDDWTVGGPEIHAPRTKVVSQRYPASGTANAKLRNSFSFTMTCIARAG